MEINARRELASRLLDGYVHGPAASTEATARALAKVAAGSGATRKLRYARLLAGAVDLDRLPHPLEAVLAQA
jgi:hypothetical protein